MARHNQDPGLAVSKDVDILSDADEINAIRQGIADLDAGRVSDADEVRSGMVARGRLTA